jgi:integrase
MSLWLSPARYVRVSKQGRFKYRRGVPAALQAAAGRREIVQSLNTKNPQEAELRALKVHGDAEAWLKALRSVRAPGPLAIAIADDLTSVNEWHCSKGFLASLGLSSVLSHFSPAPYVRASTRGVFKYRRGIPTALREAAGRKEIVQSLDTRDPHEAALRALKVHGAVEAWLKALTSREEPDRRAIDIAQELTSVDEWYRGKAFLEALGVRSIPLNELGSDEEDRRGRRQSGDPKAIRLDTGPRGLTARAMVRARKETDPTLLDGLETYLWEHKERTDAMPPLERRAWISDKERTVRYLRDALGDEFTLSSLAREHVRTYAVYLRARGLKPPSVAKSLRIAAAIVEVSLREYGINIRNSFHEFSVRDPLAARRKRLSFTEKELKTILELPVKEELSTIVTVLAFTGARLREITGLTWDDVQDLEGNQAFLELRPNEVRTLKTPWSARAVPLLKQAAGVLREHRSTRLARSKSLDGAAPVFPRYGQDGGSAAASRALMKALRRGGIVDPRKSVHSLRHTVKQRLRDVGTPKDIRDALQGHAAPDIAEIYGLGVALTVTRDALEKAFQGFG